MNDVAQNIRWTRLQILTRDVSPVSLDEAKAFLNYADASQDTLIQSLIDAATTYIEDTARRPLRQWTCEGSTGYIPSDELIILPFPPLDSLSSISYLNEAGNETTLPTTKYNSAKGGYFKIYEMPDDLGNEEKIERWKIAWTCGSTDIPSPLIVAVKMLVTGWFVARMAGDKDKYMDGAVRALVSPYTSPPGRTPDV